MTDYCDGTLFKYRKLEILDPMSKYEADERVLSIDLKLPVDG